MGNIFSELRKDEEDVEKEEEAVSLEPKRKNKRKERVVEYDEMESEEEVKCSQMKH